MGATGAMMGMSAASSLYSGMEGSQAAEREGNYKAGVARANAALARLTADETIAAGDVAAGKKFQETQERIGEEKAVQAGSGIDVATGSAALVRTGTDISGKIDEITIRQNAHRQAWGFKMEANMDDAEAQNDRITAANRSHQMLLEGGLNAIEGPMSIYATSLRFQRYMGGGDSSAGSTPYPDAG